MAKEGPNWDGLLKWSLSHADGTRPARNLRYPFFTFVVFSCDFINLIKVLALLVLEIDYHKLSG